MESLHYLLMKSHAMVHRRVTSKTASIGLTSGQPKVLDFLLRFHEADQKTIAAYCEIEPATVGSILSRMETSGLVVRRQKEGNRRSLYVSLTEKGVNAAEKLTEILRRNDIREVTIVRMDVPCCGGMQRAAETALRQSGKFIPWQVVTLGRDGNILD